VSVETESAELIHNNRLSTNSPNEGETKLPYPNYRQVSDQPSNPVHISNKEFKINIQTSSCKKASWRNCK